ncbi:MAG: hypothetical protein IJ332_03575 [Clostridia bacterium]|nr:hypothetical protein [Clostridia bacterium]
MCPILSLLIVILFTFILILYQKLPVFLCLC